MKDIKCSKCDSEDLIYSKKVLFCNRCGEHISNLNTFAETSKNKLIHLNNVLKSMETVDMFLLDKLYEKLLKKIEYEELDDDFIDTTYIHDYLKQEGHKNFVTVMFLLNRYNNIDFYLCRTKKEYIKIIFTEFIDFFTKYYTGVAISYHTLLTRIYSYLLIETNLTPSLTKNNNHDIELIFDKFLLYTNKKRVTQGTPLFHPNIVFKQSRDFYL
ncbi:putative viral late transcription factor 3 [Diachasmimorpha longicaudata entomopoxvirus]|uniref:Putative late transcription factor n=1 Tax=Diachasmimorpha longicaudata entomopoxvirus TaxID=109981 RepID=Q5GF29_9POXV|nr:putative late transcription factor [Diachasmimorpha longicaudata entomopoxvirus]YP_010796896.1 putative viral late transcription factor 3 [Diachasmimorpha longicaudata entomopoxvirus]AAT99855.1 putative late transcription factor [Diachasmimorpha longicaudata entomopoxvirus]AKS26440.1 putative viral late transcription factor 3 [Diachasmimorpha longicaudata entomopoxvirus]